MLKKLLKILLDLISLLIVVVDSFVVFGMYVTRQLSWQKPVFEPVLPADPGAIGKKGY